MCHIITLSPLDPSSKDNGIARTFISIFTPTLQNTQTLKEFLKPISLYSECKTCNLTTVCHCGCKRYLQDNGQPFLCKTYQKLFKTYQNEIQNILQIIKDKKISKSALCLNLYPNPNI